MMRITPSRADDEANILAHHELRGTIELSTREGIVDRGEVEARITGRMEQRMERRGGFGPGMRMLRRLDEDRDGTVTKAEVEMYVTRMFTQMDLDGDGRRELVACTWDGVVTALGGDPLAPLMALYLPMEGGATAALGDDSGNSIVATAHGDPVWLPTGGHDGHGAWEFDGSGDDLDGGENFPTNSSYTKTAWVYWTGSGANGGNNIISGDVNSGGHALWAADMFSNHLSAGHNGTWNSV